MTRLRKIRESLGLTQKQVAKAAGIDRSSYTHIERGDRAPSFKVALAIARIFGARVEDLFAPCDVLGSNNLDRTGTDGP